MVATTDKAGKNFVWVQREGGMWVKKYPTYFGPTTTQYTRGKTTAGKIQEITFNKGGYVKKDKHGKEL